MRAPEPDLLGMALPIAIALPEDRLEHLPRLIKRQRVKSVPDTWPERMVVKRVPILGEPP